MQGCIAPSEVPNISSKDASVFGQIAEDLIYTDFCARQQHVPGTVYVDNNNEATYFYFLKSRNPSLNLFSYASMVRGAQLGIVRPDILVDSFTEKSFYEIKPDSGSGWYAGTTKVGTLLATYRHFNLPYRPGEHYRPADITVASFAGQLTVKLKIKLSGPGLIVYKLCVDANVPLDLALLALLLRYIVKKINEQKGKGNFRPIDLKPAFAREGDLSGLARALGLATVLTGTVVGWRFFWKAVIKRFAVRGTLAALLATADGPLPVGDLVAAGMAFWTVIDIIRFNSELWSEAAVIAKQEI